MHCPKCDEPVNRTCKYCPHCGLPLADDATVLGMAAFDDGGPVASRPRWALFAGIGGGALIAVLAVVAAAVGSRSRPAAPAARVASSQLYGAAPSPGGNFPAPASAAPRPLPFGGGQTFRPAPAAPARSPAVTRMAQQPRFFWHGDPLPPPVWLYRHPYPVHVVGYALRPYAYPGPFAYPGLGSTYPGGRVVTPPFTGIPPGPPARTPFTSPGITQPGGAAQDDGFTVPGAPLPGDGNIQIGVAPRRNGQNGSGRASPFQPPTRNGR